MEGKIEGENVVFVTVGTTSFDQLIETTSNEKFIEVSHRGLIRMLYSYVVFYLYLLDKV